METTAGKYINMRVVVAMLRGINVGGHHKIAMSELRAVCENLGLADVQTYIQSGNVVCTTAKRDLGVLARRMEDSIQTRFGFRAKVITRTVEDMRRVVERNPFATRKEVEPQRLLVGFLSAEPQAGDREKLLAIDAAPEEVRIDRSELYVFYPSGMARPKLSWAVIEKTLKTSGTGRNWNTVVKLLEIAERTADAC